MKQDIDVDAATSDRQTRPAVKKGVVDMSDLGFSRAWRRLCRQCSTLSSKDLRCTGWHWMVGQKVMR